MFKLTYAGKLVRLKSIPSRTLTTVSTSHVDTLVRTIAIIKSTLINVYNEGMFPKTLDVIKFIGKPLNSFASHRYTYLPKQPTPKPPVQ